MRLKMMFSRLLIAMVLLVLVTPVLGYDVMSRGSKLGGSSGDEVYYSPETGPYTVTKDGTRFYITKDSTKKCLKITGEVLG